MLDSTEQQRKLGSFLVGNHELEVICFNQSETIAAAAEVR